MNETTERNQWGTQVDSRWTLRPVLIDSQWILRPVLIDSQTPDQPTVQARTATTLRAAA